MIASTGYVTGTMRVLETRALPDIATLLVTMIVMSVSQGAFRRAMTTQGNAGRHWGILIPVLS
jgi:hypothetical protein